MNSMEFDVIKSLVENKKYSAITEYSRIVNPSREDIIVTEYTGSDVTVYKDDRGNVRLLCPKNMDYVTEGHVAQAISNGTIFDDATDVDNNATMIERTSLPYDAMINSGKPTPKHLKPMIAIIIGKMNHDGSCAVSDADRMNGVNFIKDLCDKGMPERKSFHVVGHWIGKSPQDFYTPEMGKSITQLDKEVDDIKSTNPEDCISEDDCCESYDGYNMDKIESDPSEEKDEEDEDDDFDEEEDEDSEDEDESDEDDDDETDEEESYMDDDMDDDDSDSDDSDDDKDDEDFDVDDDIPDVDDVEECGDIDTVEEFVCNSHRRGKIYQEGLLNDLANGVNPQSKKRLFHLTRDKLYDKNDIVPKDILFKTFEPRVPKFAANGVNQDGFASSANGEFKEDGITPRICVSPSIEGCLNSLRAYLGNSAKDPEKVKREFCKDVWYVYTPLQDISTYKIKSNKDIVKDGLVWDAKYTKETWICDKVTMVLYGVIKIESVSDPSKVNKNKDAISQKGVHRLIENNDGKFSFKWKWVKSNKDLLSDPNIKSMVEEYRSRQSSDKSFYPEISKSGKRAERQTEYDNKVNKKKKKSELHTKLVETNRKYTNLLNDHTGNVSPKELTESYNDAVKARKEYFKFIDKDPEINLYFSKDMLDDKIKELKRNKVVKEQYAGAGLTSPEVAGISKDTPVNSEPQQSTHQGVAGKVIEETDDINQGGTEYTSPDGSVNQTQMPMSATSKALLNNNVKQECGDNECVKQECGENDIKQEGFLTKKPKRLKPIPRDVISYITVEMNDIHDANDQAMLAGYTCSKIELVDFYITILDTQDARYIVPHNRQYLEMMKRELERLLAQILRIRPINRSDQIWRVNYPSSI